MKNRIPDDRTTRQYLLGKFANRPRLQRELDEQMLFNDDLSDEVDAIEDEIIEEYLDGSLSMDDTRSFEQYFLRPKVRQEKLRFARLLRRRLNPALVVPVPPHIKEGDERAWMIPVEKANRSLAGILTELTLDHSVLSLRTFLELAVLVVFAVFTLLYATGLRSKISEAAVEVKHLEAELAQERAQAANAKAQLESLRLPITMTLAAHGSSRLQGETPTVYRNELAAFSQSIKVNLLLEKPVASSYDVQLQSTGGMRIWSAKLRPLISASEPPQIAFDMPVQDVNDGEYAFVVRPSLRSETASYYHFAVQH